MKKRIFSVIFAVLVIIPTCITAFAQTPPAFNKVDATVRVGTDGSLNITEEWDVTFFGSDAQKTFTRSIELPTSKDLKSVEKYDSVENIGVISDSKFYYDPNESSTMKSDSMTSYSGSDNSGSSLKVTRDSKNCNIVFTKTTDENDQHFIISYTVTGAVKKDSGKARICYRLFGSDTGTLNNVTVSVIGESISKQDTGILSLSDLSPEVTDGNVKFTSPMYTSTMTVDMTVGADSFDKGALSSYSKSADAFSAFAKKAKIAVPITVIAVLMIVLSIFKLSGTGRIRKEISASPEAFGAAAELDKNITFPQAAKLLNDVSPASSKNITQRASGIFTLSVIQLISDGVLYVRNNEVTINPAKTKELPDYEKMIAEMFLKYSENKNESLVLTKNALDTFIRDIDIYPDYFYNFVANFIGLIPSGDRKFFKSEENKKIYASCVMIKNDSGKLSNISSVLSMVLSDPDTDARQILPIGLYPQTAESLTYNSQINNDVDLFVSALCAAAAKIDRLFRK